MRVASWIKVYEQETRKINTLKQKTAKFRMGKTVKVVKSLNRRQIAGIITEDLVEASKKLVLLD